MVLGGWLAAFGPKTLKKDKNRTFLVLFGQLLEPWGAQVGPRRPSWACLGRLGVDLGRLWGGFWSIFELFWYMG